MTPPGDAPQPGSGEGGNRTRDTTIFSRVLYQLSYLAAAADGSAGRGALTSGSWTATHPRRRWLRRTVQQRPPAS